MNTKSLAAMAFLGGAILARPAEACGGLFCSGSAPIAVEQNAERVLFVENQNGTYSAYVEIQYTGAPSAFSWVVPVPDVPQLDVVPATTLQVLDLMTRPSIIRPPTQCSAPIGQGTSLGCSDAGIALRSAENGVGGVLVEDLPRVGPFEPKVVSAEDPALIFDWLTENGYLLTPAMKPIIQGYARGGMKFLALRLAPGAGVSDIAPIKMTFTTPCPMVPLALTAVSAEPEMSVLVFFLGASRMRAVNYQNIEIDPDDVRIDGSGRDNYYALVSHRIDETGGRAFVTELATPTSRLPDPATVFIRGATTGDAQAHVAGLVAQSPYFTRVYARLSAWEMTTDPEFEPSDREEDVSNIFDLSGRPALETCGDARTVPCGDTYCGPGSLCGVADDGVEGCVCKPGTSARLVNRPDLRQGSLPAIYCQDAAYDVLGEQPLLGPCADFACGGGTCVALNGFATCRCKDGELAQIDTKTGRGVVCTEADDTFGPEQLTWLEEGAGCTIGAGLPWALFGLLALRRRRIRA